MAEEVQKDLSAEEVVRRMNEAAKEGREKMQK